MTFYYNNFSLHRKLEIEGFEPYVSDDEFILDIEDDDPQFFKFLECVKLTHNPNPVYDFVSAGLDSYEGNDIESLILRGNEILGETPDDYDSINLTFTRGKFLGL